MQYFRNPDPCRKPHNLNMQIKTSPPLIYLPHSSAWSQQEEGPGFSLGLSFPVADEELWTLGLFLLPYTRAVMANILELLEITDSWPWHACHRLATTALGHNQLFTPRPPRHSNSGSSCPCDGTQGPSTLAFQLQSC